VIGTATFSKPIVTLANAPKGKEEPRPMKTGRGFFIPLASAEQKDKPSASVYSLFFSIFLLLIRLLGKTMLESDLGNILFL
jgi:hypothetical protein